MLTYNSKSATLIAEAATALRRLDALTDAETTHRLDRFEPLIALLEQIHADLSADKLSAATRRTHDLTMRLAGDFWAYESPAYRSALASALGKYRNKPKPKHSRLGALKGGRPRKDGTPTRTLESKGYSAEVLPPPKSKGVREHPELRDSIRSGQSSVVSSS